jgi:decaprenylphospho-beta-D-ribofuranose 2-oxidase
MSAPHPLLAGLPDDDAAVFAALGRVVDVATGEEIFTEGEPTRALALVDAGDLAVRAFDVEVANRPAGTWLGEFGWLVGGRATATVLAREPSRLTLVDAAALDAFLAARPRAAACVLTRIAEQVALRLRAADLHAGEPAPAVLASLWGRVSGSVSRAVRRRAEAPPPSASPSVAELGALTGWDRALAAALAPHLRERRFADGEVLVREGDPTGPEDAVWLFAEGFALVVRGAESLHVHGRGEWSGLVAWAAGGDRSATVRAAGSLRAFAVPFAAVDHLAAAEPALHAALVRKLAAQLATDAAMENARLAPSLRPPPPARAEEAEIVSYGGWQSSRAERRTVHAVEQIREVFGERSGRPITLRGGGLSFDEQALGAGVVLQLQGFDEIRFDPPTGQLRVGAGARWGDVVTALEGCGHLPPVLVSASAATVGGTLAANSVSRFSPLWGKEGKSVRSLQLLCADGEVRTCSRAEHEDLFRAAIGGWGSLGVILSATYQLRPVPVPTRVVTRVERRPGIEGLGASLLPDRSGDETVYSLVAFSEHRPRVMLARARYATAPLDAMLPHRPASRLRVPLEWVINQFSSAGQAFWNFAYDVYVREDRPYVDDLAGFTFFQDGNVRTHDGAARVGLPFRLVQQTFLVPEDRPALLERFIAEAEARLAAAGFHTSLVDSLYLPPDEPFALSSTRAGGGFVVTLTYEGPLDFARLSAELTALSADLEAEGGRVHLVKNVLASPAQMERAYAEGLAQWRRAKDRWDPENRFGNAFLDRVFPSWAGRR